MSHAKENDSSIFLLLLRQVIVSHEIIKLVTIWFNFIFMLASELIIKIQNHINEYWDDHLMKDDSVIWTRKSCLCCIEPIVYFSEL